MANIFLDANDTFTLPSTNTGDTIFGRAGGNETVILQGNPTGTTIDGNVEVVQVAGTAASTTLQVNASGQLQLVSGGVVYATFSSGLNQNVNLQFTDGNVTLKQTGAGTFTIENPTNAANNVTINSTTPQAGSAVSLGSDTSTAGGGTTGGGTGGGTGGTFVLTTGIDNIQGTAANEVIIGGAGSAGGANTLGSADVINGGGGADRLNFFSDGGAAVTVTPNVSNVEQVFIQGATTAGGTTVNMVNATGVAEIWNERSTDAVGVTVNNVQAAAAVGVKGEITGGSTYTVAFKDSLASGTNDSVTVALDDAKITNLNIGGTTAANEFETLNLSAIGKSTVTNLKDTGGAALNATTTVKATGDGSVTVTSALAATVTTVDATANKGGVNFDLSATGNVTATGGSGADTLKMGASLTTFDVLKGGAGTDILGVTTGASLVSGLQVSEFETLDIGGANANANTFDMSKLSGITTLKVGSAINATATSDVIVNNLAKGAGVEINASLGTVAADNLVINVKDAGAGSPNDSIDVLVKGSTAFATTSDLDINDIETVNLTSDKSTAPGSVTHTLTNLTADEALTINVKAGSAGLTIGDLDASSLVLFDASAATAAVSLTAPEAFTATAGVALKGGAAADTVILTGATTAGGNFLITGGGGGDKITLTATNGDGTADAGEENEILILSTAADSQAGKTSSGATKYDVVTGFDDAGAAGTTFDKIDLKAFGLTGAQQSSFVKTPSTAITDTGEVAAADQLNFFVNAGTNNGVAIVAAADVDGNTAGAQAGVFVFVDANKDGSFSAASDSVVGLIGVTAAELGNATFDYS